jgi:prepilin-type processing-associated H-X9-DG protein
LESKVGTSELWFWANFEEAFMRKLYFKTLGVTLIELLTVVSLISLLAALLAPSLGGMRDQMKIVKCMNNLRQIGGALTLYAGDHGSFPRDYDNMSDAPCWRNVTDVYLDLQSNRVKTQTTSWNVFMSRDISKSKVWFCPSATATNQDGDPTPASMIPKDQVRPLYGLNAFAKRTQWNFRLAAPPNPGKTIIVGETCGAPILDPSDPPDTTGKAPSSQHRISHRKGKGANYLFVDGHVQYIKGLQGINPNGPPAGGWKNCETAQQGMWRWW